MKIEATGVIAVFTLAGDKDCTLCVALQRRAEVRVHGFRCPFACERA